jgi:hypothetical protein
MMSRFERILTFVEADPAGVNTDNDASTRAFMDRFSAIAAEARSNGILHEVVRATSIEDIFEAMAKRRQAKAAPPHLIQIHGHGGAGRLSVGFTWAAHGIPTGRTHLLSCDPISQSLLMEIAIDVKEVHLLGCNVGTENSLSTSRYPGDGPTLLFSLSRMWGCLVRAPVDVIRPTDLDPTTGALTGVLMATARVGSPTATIAPPSYDTHQITHERVGAAPPATRSAARFSSQLVSKGERVEVQSLLSAPGYPRPGTKLPLQVPEQLRNDLAERTLDVVQLEPLPASPDLVFTAMVGDRPVYAELLAGIDLLRITYGTKQEMRAVRAPLQAMGAMGGIGGIGGIGALGGHRQLAEQLLR